jgi:hypothetical protein
VACAVSVLNAAAPALPSNNRARCMRGTPASCCLFFALIEMSVPQIVTCGRVVFDFCPPPCLSGTVAHARQTISSNKGTPAAHNRVIAAFRQPVLLAGRLWRGVTVVLARTPFASTSTLHERQPRFAPKFGREIRVFLLMRWQRLGPFRVAVRHFDFDRRRPLIDVIAFRRHQTAPP